MPPRHLIFVSPVRVIDYQLDSLIIAYCLLLVIPVWYLRAAVHYVPYVVLCPCLSVQVAAGQSAVPPHRQSADEFYLAKNNGRNKAK
jgi:hypothetical protein